MLGVEKHRLGDMGDPSDNELPESGAELVRKTPAELLTFSQQEIKA